MIVYPDINPIALRLGPIKVHWYGIMYLFGFGAGWLLGRRRAARPGSTWKPVDVDDLVFFGMVGGVLGGRLGYVLIYGLSFWTAQRQMNTACPAVTTSDSEYEFELAA